MSYLETKSRGKEKYTYFVKKWTLQNKPFVLRKYIGKDTGLFSKENYLVKNMNLLVDEELNLRTPIWKPNINFVYDPGLVERIEKKAILLNNLIEAHSAEKIMQFEFAKEFIYNSNNIEGSKIPKEQLVELFEKGNTKYKNKNELAEIENSIKALYYIKKDFSFTIKNIKSLYYILTKNLIQENGAPYPKGFKKQPIIVGNSTTSEPKNVEPELKALINWNKQNATKLYPLKRAFEFHSTYESIHPFTNGNGRTGRLIMNKILMQNNYPPIIIYKENKLAYFNAINAMREGDKKKYFQFMLKQAEKTYDQMIKTIKYKK
ncbi:MAG: Fic family protein [Candidatus ainarchaeum sp.]|nr:Fic family protein [Candidatus ainarchaeum sp.]